MNIVLIEDNAGDVFLFEDLLTDLGFNLDSLKVLKDGEAAVSYLSCCNPNAIDLVFLDINLPKFNGHDILDRLNNDLHQNNIAVVVLSSSSNQRDMMLLEFQCVVKYILKPIAPEQLSQTLNTFIKN